MDMMLLEVANMAVTHKEEAGKNSLDNICSWLYINTYIFWSRTEMYIHI